MHAYVITAQPGRLHRTLRAVGRGLRDLGLVLLGVLVFAIRATRAIANLIAHHAARLEARLATRAGRQPVGQTIGVGVTAAFIAEFHRAARTQTPA